MKLILVNRNYLIKVNLKLLKLIKKKKIALNQWLNNTLNQLTKKYKMIKLKKNKNKFKIIFLNRQSDNLLHFINPLSLKGFII